MLGPADSVFKSVLSTKYMQHLPWWVFSLYRVSNITLATRKLLVLTALEIHKNCPFQWYKERPCCEVFMTKNKAFYIVHPLTADHSHRRIVPWSFKVKWKKDVCLYHCWGHFLFVKVINIVHLLPPHWVSVH